MKQLSILLKFLNHMIRLLNCIILLFPVTELQLLKVRTNFLIIILQHVTAPSLLRQGNLPFAHIELFMRISIKLFIFVFVKLICKGQTYAVHFT